jgi:hypothetical protein
MGQKPELPLKTDINLKILFAEFHLAFAQDHLNFLHLICL